MTFRHVLQQTGAKVKLIVFNPVEGILGKLMGQFCRLLLSAGNQQTGFLMFQIRAAANDADRTEAELVKAVAQLSITHQVFRLAEYSPLRVKGGDNSGPGPVR